MGYKKDILNGHVTLTLSLYTLLKQLENRKMFESLDLEQPEKPDSLEGELWYNAVGSCLFWTLCEDVQIAEGSEDIHQLAMLQQCWEQGKDAEPEVQWQLWQELLDDSVTAELWDACKNPDSRLLAPPLMQVAADETKKKQSALN